LTILFKELEADYQVAADAARNAGYRVQESSPGHLEACAYELNRFYNVLEKMLERICEAFENHLEKTGDYHEKLIQRLALNLDGIRPAFIPPDRTFDIRELKGFRHVMRHAYDLRLRSDRLRELVGIAEAIAAELPTWSSSFVEQVKAEQGW